MKTTLVLIILNIVLLVITVRSRFWVLNKEDYIPKEVLEISTPIDVKIDTEFIKNLKPAYEQ